MCWWPIFRKLGTCSTTDALSPRTLLTKKPAKKKKKTRKNSNAFACARNTPLFHSSPAKTKNNLKKKNEKKEKVQLTKDDMPKDMHLKKKRPKTTAKQLTKHDAFVTGPLPVQCADRKLGTCSTTDALSPRTLLTENICESVQKILQHSPAKKRRKKRFNSPKMMPFFTGPLPVQCPGGQFSGSLAPAPRRTTCRLGHF